VNKQLTPPQGGEFTSDSIPTIAFNRTTLKRGHVSITAWDLAGQPQYRSMWPRYTASVTCILFIVDSSDRAALPVAKEELHRVMEDEGTKGIPLLVLSNKSDVEGRMGVDEVIEGLELKRVRSREVSCYGVSAKEETNLEAVLQWLVARSGSK
jgi:ADP-ribosylation factor-like protein 8